MRFSRGSISSSTITASPRVQMMFMGYPAPRNVVAATTVLAADQQPTVVATTSTTTPKTMVWGEPTWFLLHTLVHKVKAEYFSQVRAELIDIIVRICTNLPCPMCANHSAEYLGKINFDAIQTKQDLKNLMFQFHNSVNVRKSFAQFNYADLDAKYEAANTLNIIRNFMSVFQQSNGGQINVNTFSKNRTILHYQNWFRHNLPFFDP